MVIALIIVGVVLLAIVLIYNSLVRSKVRVDEAWSDITVQMKRRFDLIPNLVESVKAYAKHESDVFEKVTEARANSLGAQSVGEVSKAEGDFQKALKSLFAVAEAYPQLRASENFQKLQDEVTDTEDKIQAARRFYNSSVRDYNTKTQTFPTNIFAGLMSFRQRDFFEIPGEEATAVAEPVKVDFSDDKKA
jgi:LemA protein